MPEWLQDQKKKWMSCSSSEICDMEGPYIKDKSIFRLPGTEL
jgi:hypothetical protein